MKTLEQFKAEQMTDWEFATEYEKIALNLKMKNRNRGRI